jgi:hypothetical protein
MLDLVFWKNWLREYRITFYLTGALFVFSALAMWAYTLQAEDGVIAWEKLQEQKIVETEVHHFRLGPFELSVPGESFIIFEYFNGGDFVPNTTASYIFLFVFMAALTLLVAIITTFERFWFYIAIAFLMLLVSSLKLEVLQVFGQRNIIPTIVVLVVYGGVAFYFQSFRPETRFAYRWLTFVTVQVICAAVIFFGSTVQYPMLHLAVTAYTPGLIMAVVFFLMIAHEIFAGFVYIASQSPRKGLRDFYIISVVWLANLIIAYLHEIGSIHWNFVYINLYLLLTVSAFMGVWGFRNREPAYENLGPFQPFGTFFFLAMGATAFSFIAYAAGNANSAAIVVIRKSIIYSHLGFGVAFLLYFTSNFLVMMEKNISIYRVLYKPHRMPYFTFRFAGLVIVIACVLYADWRDYVYRGMAGFYNSMGDLYGMLDNKSVFTESYYQQAATYAFHDHHSNYILAKMKSAALDLESAHNYYYKANGRTPSAYSQVNAGNLFIWESRPFVAIRTYLQAVETGGPALQNNLGFAYARLGHTDSASIFLGEARNHSLSKEPAETNFFALATRNDLPIKADSVLKLFNVSAPGTMANAVALATRQKQPLELTIDPLQYKKLNLHSATLLNNYILREAHTLDTAFLAAANGIASDPANADFSESLKFSLAFGYYHQGNVTRALSLLAELTYLSAEQQGKYNYIQGLWVLEQGSAEMAISYFDYALGFDYKKAALYHAIAVTEAGRGNEALGAWDSLAVSGDEAESFIATTMRRILTMPEGTALALNDEEKYQFCRYRLGVKDTVQFTSLANSFKNTNYKAQVLLEMSRKLFKAGQVTQAIRYFSRISGLEISNKRLYDDVRFFELEMLASRKETFQIIEQLNKGVEFSTAHSLEKHLYTALLQESNGQLVEAARNYYIAGTYNPYYEVGIILAADFFRRQDAKSLKAYDMLAEAIQINNKSLKLMLAYVAEASRMGFDEYAASAAAQAEALRRNGAQ